MITPDVKTLFPLDDGVTYLDHGGFGVAPRKVREAQDKCRELVERNPKAFFAYQWPEEWNARIDIVAKRFGVNPRNLAFVQNATDGVNAVLGSLSFAEGDEILLTNQTYGGVGIAAREIAKRSKATIVAVELPFPIADSAPADYCERISRALTPRTKLAILDHISSPTALVMPIQAMTAECRKRGVSVLIDAAHAPGQVPLDIAAINADWYVGNLHKWCFAPRSCAFLWSADQWLEQTRPSVLSWHAHEPYSFRFNWTGTRDVSQIMAVPDAFEFMDAFGEAEVRAHNQALIADAIGVLTEKWSVRCDTPTSMVGAMATLPLPSGLPFAANEKGCADLQRLLILEKKMSVAVPFAAGGQIFVRIAAQIYNDRNDYLKLGEVISELIPTRNNRDRLNARGRHGRA